MYKFNPITGELDLVGEGSSIIGGYASGSQQHLAGSLYPQAVGATILTGGEINYWPILVEFECEISSLTPRASTGTYPVGNFVMGLYEWGEGEGGDLIVQTVEGDTSITLQTLAITPQTLQPGYYWACWHADVDYPIGSRINFLSILGVDGAVNTRYAYRKKTLTYNSTLPATFEAGTSLVSASRAPRIGWDIS